MKLFKFILIVQFFLLAGSTIYAQDLLTLEDAIAVALKNNHQIQVSRNSVEISKNNAQIGNAGFLPKIDLSSGVNYSDAPTQTLTGIENMQSTATSAQLEATYNIFNGLGDYFYYRKLQTQSTASALSSRNSIENTIVQVISAYYAVAAAEESRRITTEALQISAERLQRAQKRADFGQANKLDMLNAQVDLNADSITFLSSEQQLAENKHRLQLLLAEEDNKDFTVDTRVSFQPLGSREALIQSALNNNASYLLTLQNLKESGYSLNQARSAYLPKINLRGSYGYSQSAPDLAVEFDDPYHSASAGLSLSFNLFNGLRNNIQTQNAKIANRNQELILEQTRLALDKDLVIAYTAYQNKRTILEMDQKNLQSVELNFQRTGELYNLGQLTTTQFREAQLNLIRAKNNISQSRYQAKIAETNLLQLSGKLLQKR